MINNMKKYLLSFAVAMMGAAFLTACTNDDNNSNSGGSAYLSTSGALIINNGSVSSGIDGSLTFLDLSTNPAGVQQNVYKTANGMSLGGT